MNEREYRKNQRKSGGADDQLQTLLQQVSARPRPPDEAEHAARAALSAEWRQISGRRKRRRYMAGLAAAASVLLTVGVMVHFTGWPSANGPGLRLAKVENLVGTAQRNVEHSTGRETLNQNEWLVGPQYIQTGPGSAVGLLWTNGQSIRLDEHTRLRLESEQLVRLERGQIYIDTAHRTVGAVALSIATPAGEVRHVGTRYMTTVTPQGTTVSVRSGTVSVDLSGIEHILAQGEQLNVSGDGERSVRQIEIWGEHWQWAERITPAFNSDGKSIADLIDWVGDETGHLIEYDTQDAETQARNTVLRGQLEMEPMMALTMITQTSGMEASVADGLITISLARVD